MTKRIKVPAKSSLKERQSFIQSIVKLNNMLSMNTLQLDPRYLDAAVVGASMTDKGWALEYNYERIVKAFMTGEKWDYEEAIEWTDYNTVRGWPYITAEGAVSPILLEPKEKRLTLV